MFRTTSLLALSLVMTGFAMAQNHGDSKSTNDHNDRSSTSSSHSSSSKSTPASSSTRTSSSHVDSSRSSQSGSSFSHSNYGADRGSSSSNARTNDRSYGSYTPSRSNPFSTSTRPVSAGAQNLHSDSGRFSQSMSGYSRSNSGFDRGNTSPTISSNDHSYGGFTASRSNPASVSSHPVSLGTQSSHSDSSRISQTGVGSSHSNPGFDRGSAGSTGRSTDRFGGFTPSHSSSPVPTHSTYTGGHVTTQQTISQGSTTSSLGTRGSAGRGQNDHLGDSARGRDGTRNQTGTNWSGRNRGDNRLSEHDYSHDHEIHPSRVDPIRVRSFPDDPGEHRWEHDWSRSWDHDHSQFGLNLFVEDGGVAFRLGYADCNFWGPSHYWHYGRYGYVPGGVYLSSPWYVYPELPPYVSADYVVTGGNYYEPSYWQPYDYSYPGDTDWGNGFGNQGGNSYGDRSELDHSIDLIVNSFASHDVHQMDDVLPRNGDIAIRQDGNYRYALDSRDFYNMYTDMVESTKTQGYHILSVTRSGDWVKVTARQDRLDPWNQRVSVYHEYYLQREDSGYVVRRFGTSTQRSSW